MSAINSSSPTARNQSPSRSCRRTEELITYCCVCFVPAPNVGNANGNDPPFWLTSCGHIVCNSHCFPNGVPHDAAERTHTCPYCGSGGISLADLGAGKVSVELRDYFRPEAELLEDVTGAIKFRMSNALRIASHYKALAEKLQGKVDDQRRVLLKVKDELIEGKELRKNKKLMEAEIASLREENTRLRAQLSSAQLASLDLDLDVPQSAQQHRYRSNTEVTRQGSTSPAGINQENPNFLKRKADDASNDSTFRAREFRNEMNKRQAQMQAMPPPPIPQREKQQYRDNRQEGRYTESMQEQDQEPRSEFSNQFQQLGYSPRTQPQHAYGDQLLFRDNTSSQHGIQHHSASEQFPVDPRRQFVDLTESPDIMGSKQKSQNGFANKPQSNSRIRNDYLGNTFQSPLRVPTPRPIDTLPVRGSRVGVLINQSPQSGIGYVNKNNISPPRNRDGTFSSGLMRQGESTTYPYDRDGQLKVPSTPKTTNTGGGSDVISPFFVGPGVSAVPGSRELNIGNSIRRPASVAAFTGQRQGNLNRSHGAGLGESGFFSRQDDLLSGGANAVKAPVWSTPRPGTKVGSFQGGGEARPGTEQGFSRIRGNIFSPQRTSGITDRPGLRRAVRRD